MATAPQAATAVRGGAAALAGQFLFVFAVLALSGPGRIDIPDGQVRYEVARGLLDLGDPVVRDPAVWFAVFPGRDGRRYSEYRFPQSLLGVPAIWLADATGPASEARRHFFFVLTSAFAGAVLAVTYSVWFRAAGLAPRAAMLWAAAGIFCTPSWYYGTSTFDDILGSAAVVLMTTVAYRLRESRPLAGAVLSGLLAGLAFNCKQPLGAFALVGVVAALDPARPWRGQLGRAAAFVAAFALGLAAYVGYDWYKFPMGLAVARAPFAAEYVPNESGSVLATLRNLLHLAVSPSAGVFWYCPPLLLALAGLAAWRRRERALAAAALISTAVFVVFIASLNIFKGDPAWGPRYLTPVFALLWLFAPAGAPTLGPNVTRLLLGLGVAVQLLGLSVDPHRLYFERNLRSAFYYFEPWAYLNPAVAHLPNRPREIAEVLAAGPAEEYAPTPEGAAPTHGLPVMEEVYHANAVNGRVSGRLVIRRYHVLNSPRPWWLSQRFLAPGERPVDLARTAGLFVAIAGAGLALMVAGTRRPSAGG